MLDKPVTLGLIVGNRGFFPSHLCEEGREIILKVLEETDWVIRGPKGAAAILGKHEATLRTRMKKLGIQRPVARDGRAVSR